MVSTPSSTMHDGLDVARRASGSRACYNARVRVIVARCSVTYEGRLGARLPEATRLLVLKADGSIAVHSDSKAYKPLNWMSPPCTIRERDGVIVAESPKGETLRVELLEVLDDHSFDLGDDPGPREGRRRGRAPAADRGAGRGAARGLHAGPARVPDRHRSGRPALPRRRRPRGRGRDQAGRGDRGRRAADPLPGAPRPRHPARADPRHVRRHPHQAAGPRVRDEPRHRLRRGRRSTTCASTTHHT